MTDINALELIQLLESLKDESKIRDWGIIWEDEEEFEQLQENLEDVIRVASIANPGANLSETENFVGKIAIAKVKLGELVEQDNGQDAVIAIGTALDADIKKMLFNSPLVKKFYNFLKNNSHNQAALSDGVNNDLELGLGMLFVLASLSVLVMGDECCEEDGEEC